MLRSVVVHDPADTRLTTGDLFLAVGAESPTDAVQLASQARAAVLVARETAPLTEATLVEARDNGLVVVLVDPGVTWSQLCGVAYGMVLEGRETESGRGPTDLFALADTLAAAVGASVVIEDQMSRVLAYSNVERDTYDRVRLDTIVGRRLPEPVRTVLVERGVFAHLARSDEPLFVEPSDRLGFSGRVVIAVRAGRELLGSLWVESASPLTGRNRTALEDGARTAALHLMRSRASADLERQVESDLVIRLLEGTADAPTVLSQLGLPRGQYRVVALQAHVHDEHHAGVLLAFEHATTGFGWSRPGRSTLFGQTVYTVLPDEADTARPRQWISTLIAGLPNQVLVHAGVGGTAEAASLPASRREADESLSLHASRPDSPAVVYDESWNEILLQRLRTAASSGRMPVRDPVAELRRHDAEHGTRYVETLYVWLTAHGDAATTARRLGVHRNTVRYRLRKMVEVAPNLELDHPDKRLAMAVSLAAVDGGP